MYMYIIGLLLVPKTAMVADVSVNTTLTPGSTVNVADGVTSTRPEMTIGL